MKEVFLDITAAFSFHQARRIRQLESQDTSRRGRKWDRGRHTCKLMYRSKVACHYDYTSKCYADN